MPTRAEIIAARATAGAAYLAAAEAYRAAWVELHGYDLAVSNGNVAGNAAANGFGPFPGLAGHNEFLRDRIAIEGDITGAARARGAQIVASWSGS
jgi:hypothetical protein